MLGGARRSPEDTALVSAILTEAALCVECMAKKTDLPTLRVQIALEAVAKTVTVAWREAPCDACQTTKKVFRLT